MKPVFGIAIIRLASVHDGMDKRAVGVVNRLRNHVRRFEVVVPQEYQSPNERLFRRANFPAIKQLIKFGFQFGLFANAGARSRSKLGQFRRLEQLLNLLHGCSCHGFQFRAIIRVSN